MFTFLDRLSRRLAPTSSRRRDRRPPTRRPTLEMLEDRVVPALGKISAELHVNTKTARDQSQSATASDPSGNSVVVWTHQASSTNTDIRAQRYDAAGNKVG